MDVLLYSSSLFSCKLPFVVSFWVYDVGSDSAWALLGFILWFSTLRGLVGIFSSPLVEKKQREKQFPWPGHNINLKKNLLGMILKAES